MICLESYKWADITHTIHILSSFIEPNVVPNLYDFLPWTTKGKMTASVNIHFHCMDKRCNQIRVWNNMTVSKWWQNIHFGWPNHLKDQIVPIILASTYSQNTISIPSGFWLEWTETNRREDNRPVAHIWPSDTQYKQPLNIKPLT